MSRVWKILNPGVVNPPGFKPGSMFNRVELKFSPAAPTISHAECRYLEDEEAKNKKAMAVMEAMKAKAAMEAKNKKAMAAKTKANAAKTKAMKANAAKTKASAAAKTKAIAAKTKTRTKTQAMKAQSMASMKTPPMKTTATAAKIVFPKTKK